MKNICLAIFALCMFSFSFSQNKHKPAVFNFGFEKVSHFDSLPNGWMHWGRDYSIKIDSTVKHSGKYSLLIEPGYYTNSTSSGTCAFAIPSIYTGKYVTVKCWLKLQDVAKKPAGVFLRLDGEGGTLALDYNQVKGTNDWTLYTVTLFLSEKTQTIYIGATHWGTGKMWIDDFEVYIDTKDIAKAKLKKPSNLPADNDTEFNKGSGVISLTLTQNRIDNLTVLGKVWGFLKYYHPSVAAGNYNWDFELFRILPVIVASTDKDLRNSVLSAWIEKLGKVEAGKTLKTDSSKVKLFPDIDWISDTATLGDKLSAQLEKIKNAKRNGKNYYVKLNIGVGNPDFSNEIAYNKNLFTDPGFRLLSLFRYWNIIEYFYPNRHLIGENWNNVLREFIPKFIEASGETEYDLAVLAIIARIHDSHANIWSYSDPLNEYWGRNYAPLEITFIENKAVVTGYLDDELGKNSGLKTGDVISYIDGESVDNMIQMRLPYTPASNYPTQLRDMARNLMRTNEIKMKVRYTHAGSDTNTIINCYPASEMDIYKKYRSKDTCFRYVKPDIFCIYPGTIKNEYLSDVMPGVMNAKGIIIDLRCYPNDFIVFTLSKYLYPASANFVKFSDGNILTPGLFKYSAELEVGGKNKDYFKGKVVIIVNEITQSNAEYTAMAFQKAPSVTVIGSQTAGADGNVSSIFLPGHIKTMISGIGVYYPDGKETQRIGIVPDVEIKPTIKGILEGRDELMEKAIDIIEGK
jgi:hypothetical protein